MNSSLSALRSASCLLLSPQAVTRTFRLDVKRCVYLSGPDYGKKKKNQPSRDAVETEKRVIHGIVADAPKTDVGVDVAKIPLNGVEAKPSRGRFRDVDGEAFYRALDDSIAEDLGRVATKRLNDVLPAEKRKAKDKRESRESPSPSSSGRASPRPTVVKKQQSRDAVQAKPSRGRADNEASYRALNESMDLGRVATKRLNDVLPAEKRPTVVKIDSLSEKIRIRREEASRTLLFSPDLAHATNPCPRYMRHKIESYVGRVRHVALTSLVTSSKIIDVFGTLSVNTPEEKFLRKNLLVEFRDSHQMEDLIRNYSKPFPNDKATFNNRLLYCPQPWSQASSTDSDVELTAALNSCSDITQQMHSLVARTELDDAGLRARFFLCDVMESLIKPIFPGCNLIPFGSTLSGLGRADSDMDIVMRLPSNKTKVDLPFRAFSVRGGDFPDARSIVVRQLTLVHEVMRLALPGYCEYTRIFRANVPIITFRHSYTNLCCDLSVQSNDSILAAQLFYAYTLLDPRVRPFLFALRRWSIAQGISSFVTNFPLCCLALFYLMEEKVVPPMAFDGDVSGNVISIPTAVHWQSPNATSTLEDLLRGFFRFYVDFPFERDAISVLLGKRREKLTMDSVEVENPLDRELNCARLIGNSNGYPTFQAAIVAADKALQERGSPIADDDDGVAENWGLSCLIDAFSWKDEAEVFIDAGDEAVVESDGDLLVGGGGGEEAVGTLIRQQLRPSKRGEVLSILNGIFESDGEKIENEPDLKKQPPPEKQPMAPSSCREGEQAEFTLHPARFEEDEEVVLDEELFSWKGKS